MLHRKLVFAAFLVGTILFSASLATAQRNGRGEEVVPDVKGRVTDFAGRSIRNAEIKVFSLETGETHEVRSNAFGYYQIAGLTFGETYIIVPSHRRYLFIIPTTEFTVGDRTIEQDFQGEPLSRN